jgi:hypothetical protein
MKIFWIDNGLNLRLSTTLKHFIINFLVIFRFVQYISHYYLDTQLCNEINLIKIVLGISNRYFFIQTRCSTEIIHKHFCSSSSSIMTLVIFLQLHTH